MSMGTAQPGIAPKHPNILVVDDDAGFCEAVSQLLQREGFTVATATDFQPALAALESNMPLDLLITDVVMPSRVNGMALSRMARMRRRDIKVIYLTGFEIPGIDKEALGPVLRKPCSDEALIAEVKRALADV